MTSDELDAVASNALLDITNSAFAKLGGRVLFWTCPRGCHSFVSWRIERGVHVAKCEKCGTESIKIDESNPEEAAACKNTLLSQAAEMQQGAMEVDRAFHSWGHPKEALA